MIDEKQFEEKLTLLDRLQSHCTHCGLCSEACATFQLTGWEHESPRGRLHLATQFLHGHIHPQSAALSTFDRCLSCQACEPLCPHQVSYGQIRQIVQELRRELNVSHSSAIMTQTQYSHWIKLAQCIGKMGWRHYVTKWLRIPSLDWQSQGSFAKSRPRPRTGQPVLAICCAQDLFQHDIIKQTLTFMQRLGYSLEVDRKQPCCGALFERLVQGGEETVCYPKEWQQAYSLQNQAIKAFSKWMPRETYFLSRGCQCFVSKQNIQALDLYAWIENILDQQKLTLSFSQSKEVYYQPYCGSQKGMQDSIWRLLHRIEGLKVHEVPYAQTCCGGYCGESFLHPIHAQALVRQKVAHLPEGATVIVTSPDCYSLFKSQCASQNLNLCYPIQLLMQGVINDCSLV